MPASGSKGGGSAMRPRSGAALALCLLAGVALGACSTLGIESKKVDYKSASQLPPLDVPPDLARPSGDDRFRVPDSKGIATYSDYSRERGAQPGAATPGVLPAPDGARVVRDGSQRWLVVKGDPERVWPVVKDFWQEAGFIVNVEVPEAGVMETDWAESRAKIQDGTIRGFLSRMLDYVYSTAERDKFRTRLERGTEPGTTEIYVSHRGMEEVYVETSPSADRSDTRWQPRPPDPNLEAEMLGRLLVRFGVDAPRARAIVAKPAAVPLRAKLLKGADGIGAVSLDEQFDRAWRRVGLALDRVGFTVEDRDRSKGLYYVRYIDQKIDSEKTEERSFLSKLKFWGDSDKPKPAQYRILVKGADGAGSEVNVLSKDGGQENSDTAGKILSLLYEQLK